MWCCSVFNLVTRWVLELTTGILLKDHSNRIQQFPHKGMTPEWDTPNKGGDPTAGNQIINTIYPQKRRNISIWNHPQEKHNTWIYTISHPCCDGFRCCMGPCASAGARIFERLGWSWTEVSKFLQEAEEDCNLWPLPGVSRLYVFFLSGVYLWVCLHLLYVLRAGYLKQ